MVGVVVGLLSSAVDLVNARRMARPPAPWASISVQSMSNRARRASGCAVRGGRRPAAAAPPFALGSSAAAGRIAAVARAAGRLAEAVQVARVARQRHLASRDVLALLRMHEGARDEVREHMAVVAVPEPIVLIAMAVDAAVGLHRDALRVALLAGDLRVRAGQRLRMCEVLAAHPGPEVVAVLAGAAIGVRSRMTVAAVLRPVRWQVKHEAIELGRATVTPGAPACTTAA